MVASLPIPTQQPRREQGSLRLLKGSLSARKIERQAPWLAVLHRFTDGALAGLSLTMLGLSALTFHWQNQWARSYDQLETAQVLEHRLQESAALLEQHHLGVVRRPGVLVPTSSYRLIHMPEPATRADQPAASILPTIELKQIHAGY